MPGLRVSTKYTILCVDDNQNNLFTLNALLSTLSNVYIIECLSAQESLGILLKQSVDLILCDIQMPEMNGFELVTLIKSNKKTKHIPVVFVTAVFKSEEFIAQGFELGAVDYITKPIDDNQLLNKINLYLQVFKEQNKLRHSEKKFYDIAQIIREGIFTLDLQFKSTFVNKYALQCLGYKGEELLDVYLHDYISYKDIYNKALSSKDSKMYKSLKDTGTYKAEGEIFVKKDGSFLNVSITCTPLYTDDVLSGYIVVFKDVDQ